MHRSDLSPCALRWALRGLIGLTTIGVAYAALAFLGFDMQAQAIGYGLGLLTACATAWTTTTTEQHLWGDERDEERP